MTIGVEEMGVSVRVVRRTWIVDVVVEDEFDVVAVVATCSFIFGMFASMTLENFGDLQGKGKR